MFCVKGKLMANVAQDQCFHEVHELIRESGVGREDGWTRQMIRRTLGYTVNNSAKHTKSNIFGHVVTLHCLLIPKKQVVFKYIYISLILLLIYSYLISFN